MAKKFNGHYRLLGQGAPLLCIPGFGSSSRIFDRLAEQLQDRFQLVLPDNRGMGRSPRVTEPYGLEDLAADAIHLMDDLGHERFAVLGLSMGGFIAQLLVLNRPQRVSRLLLLCTSSGGAVFKKLFPGMTEQQVRSIYTLQPERRTEAALSPSICPLLKSHYPSVYNYITEMRNKELEEPAQVMLQYAAVNAFMEKSLELHTIRCPTLILSGDSDTLVPLENARLLQKKIPNAVLTVFEKTDHLFFLEKVDAVARRVKAFLT